MIPQRQKLLFIERRQGGSGDVEPKMDRRGNFIDVLPARALSPNGRHFDFFVRNRHVR
jgi:hypothetical protein